ncbi:hypothetical protein [Desulfovibrio sp. ZJ369]|uniref:hypothetical protein n=1 Tax=Desulfovibrio sp. ZJ369 TaxID=2709793 RepID=UPI0013EBB918|nr:hypothetical protein [Desulfovibrio sp. ZJ369]
MTFYKSQRWHSGEKRGFRLNVRRVAAAAAFWSAEHFQSENALEYIAFATLAPARNCASKFRLRLSLRSTAAN